MPSSDMQYFSLKTHCDVSHIFFKTSNNPFATIQICFCLWCKSKNCMCETRTPAPPTHPKFAISGKYLQLHLVLSASRAGLA